MKTTYTATFSTGTITRTSNHEYKTAGAYINKTTGEIKNVTFSKGQARPSSIGLFAQNPNRKWYATNEAYKKAIEASKKAMEDWKIEVVKVN